MESPPKCRNVFDYFIHSRLFILICVFCLFPFNSVIKCLVYASGYIIETKGSIVYSNAHVHSTD